MAIRPRMTEQEYAMFKSWKDQNAGITAECESVGIDLKNARHYWYKGKHYSIFAKGPEFDFDSFKDSLIDSVKRHAPKYSDVKQVKQKDGHLLVIDPADIHVGKLCRAFETGDEYNHKIAINRVLSGVDGIISKSSGFKIDQVLFVMGNDMLHVDGAKSTTTSGTFQDTELMWYDAFKIGQQLLVDVIEKLRLVAPVHIQYNPSNHDYVSGFMLAQILDAWFSKCKNVTFDVSISHRKYYKYHLNLIGSTHGDGAREQDLALLMAHESKHWNECKHRYVYTHHIHSKKSKDYMSVCIESLRSPSGTDSWHHRNGYQHAPKAVEGYIHHKEHGQIARLTHLF